MRLIQHCRNPAHRLLALLRQEELHLGVLKKRVFAWIEERFAFEEQGRDPEVVPLIDPPRECDERFRRVRRDWEDSDSRGRPR
jgi:hypothetical protein